MRYRNIRVKATGQWVKVLFTTQADTFSVDGAIHLAEMADALGVSAASLEVVDSDSDQQTGELLALPTVTKPLRTIEDLTSIPRVDWTPEEIVALG